jgi:gamma-glutamyltranspeptidase/glutathione hydrolase
MQSGEWPGTSDIAAGKKRPNHSSGVVAVDRWGNMAVVAHTINTNLWGDTGLFVDGVSIPDSACHNRSEMQVAGAGNRLPGRMVPLLVLKDGRAVLGSSATGVGHTKTLQVLVNILDYDMDPRAATDMPAFLLCGHVEEGTFDSRMLNDVQGLGVRVQTLSGAAAAQLHGNWLGVQRNPRGNGWQGAATIGPRGQVQGY